MVEGKGRGRVVGLVMEHIRSPLSRGLGFMYEIRNDMESLGFGF